jgi:hypothetical protein
MVLKGLASSNPRGPALMFHSIHVLSRSRLLCVQCLQSICEQTKHACNVSASSGSTYCELPYVENIFLVPKPSTNKHPEFSCNSKNFKCMLLQEQSCDVSAFTYSQPPLADLPHPHSITIILIHICWICDTHTKPKEHGCFDFKTGTGNIKVLVKTESCAFVLHPAQWKVAEMILILKPGKSNELTSYLPTSLLPTASKGPLKKAPPIGWK